MAYPFVEVALDQYTMRASAGKLSAVKVRRFRIGLGITEPNGHWNVARWAEAVRVDTMMAAGETKLIEGYKAVIPIDGLQSIKDDWLVLEVEIESGGRVGTTYAHSPRGLFQAEPLR